MSFAFWKQLVSKKKKPVLRSRLAVESLESRQLLSATVLGNEQVLNATEFGDARHPSVATDSSGNYVAVWQNFQQDGDGQGVAVRRFNAQGTALTGDVPVNVTVADDQVNPKIAMFANGEFVVVWDSVSATKETNVFARRFNAAGQPISGEISVNSTTAGSQSHPNVAVLPNGGFVVAWKSIVADNAGAVTSQIDYRRFSAGNAPIEAEQIARSIPVVGIDRIPNVPPAISSGTAGNFVVGWSEENALGNSDIFARRYDLNGLSLEGSPLGINTTTANAQLNPSVAFVGNDIVFVWQSLGQDGEGEGVIGRRIPALGVIPAANSEFIVNSLTAVDQFEPHIAAGPAGYYVTWTSIPTASASGRVIFRQFGSNDVPRGGDIEVSAPFGVQFEPAVSVSSTGKLGALVWTGNSIGTGQGFEIAGRRFQETIDITLLGTDTPDPVLAGQPLSYTLTVTNTSLAVASNVVVSDTIPPGTTVTNMVSSQGNAPTQAAGVVTAQLGSLNPGTSATVTIQLTAPTTPGAITNQASVTLSDLDTNLLNNVAFTNTTVNPAANLLVTFVDVPDPIMAGRNLTYTATVKNLGPNPATNIVFTQSVPAGTTVFTRSASQGPLPTIANGVLTANLGALAKDATATVTLVVTTSTTPGQLTSTAQANATEGDPVLANNSVTQTTQVVPVADLVVTINDAPDPVAAGQNVTYTVSVLNKGPNVATNTQLANSLPAGMTLGSTTNSAGNAPSVVGQNLLFGLGDLPVNGTATVTITGQAPGTGPIVATANVVSTAADPIAGDNFASTTTAINPSSDLQVTQTVAPGLVPLNENATYTVFVKNNGPSPATNVVLTDTFPANTTFVSAVPSQGNFSRVANVITANLGSIPSQATVTLTVVVQAPNVVGQLVNQAAVVTTTPDPVAANNNNSTAAAATSFPDLVVNNTTAVQTVAAGTTVTYTYTVSNTGTAPATNVFVEDHLPAGAIPVSATSSQGSNVPTADGTLFNVGTIAPNNTVSFTVRATLTQAGASQHRIVANGPTDRRPGDNSLQQTINVTALAASRLSFETVPATANVLELINPNVRVRLADQFGNAVPNANGNVSLTFGSNPAGGSLVGTLVATAVNGIATFPNVAISAPGAGYTLVAQSAGFTAATSTPINVVAPARQLDVARQPVDTVATRSMGSITVRVEDLLGTMAQGFAGNVVLTLGTQPAGAQLTGGTTVPLINGLATFTNLSLNIPGSYTFIATVPGLGQVTSLPFNITPLQTAAPTTENERVVEAMYQAILGRAADVAGRQGWAGQLEVGFPTSDIAQAIGNSVEGRARQINELYRNYLERDADAEGLNGFLAQVFSENPLRIEDIRDAILGSDEYAGREGGLGRFVNAVFQDVLQRPADPSGLGTFNALLNEGVPRPQIAGFILFSFEGRARLVEHTYRQFLGREGEAEGVLGWTNALLGGFTENDLRNAFLGSAEFFNRFR